MALVFGMTVVGCGGDDPDDGSSNPGKLTITGLNTFNGKYVVAEGDTDKDWLIAAASLNVKTETITALVVTTIGTIR